MIRPAKREDMGAIAAVYEAARKYMRDNGNTAQWGYSYTDAEISENDYVCGNLYVCVENGAIFGVFAFIVGEEPTYARIDNGSWGASGPYGTIHRLASNGTVGGVFSRCFEFCVNRIGEIRIDTHEDNRIMRRLISEHGFEERGTIYVRDGSPRIAYQYPPEG